MKKKLALAAKIVGIAAIWSVTIVALAVMVEAPHWFWFHYIGTMPYETYALIENTIGISAFLGAIVLVVCAAGSSVYICVGKKMFERSSAEQKSAA